MTFLFLKSHGKSNFPVRITKTIWNFFTNMFSISLHSFKNIYIFYYKILYFLKLQKHLQFSLIIINYIYNSKLKIWSCKRDSLVKLHWIQTEAIPDELFECVWPFSGLARNGLTFYKCNILKRNDSFNILMQTSCIISLLSLHFITFEKYKYSIERK